MAEEAQKHAHEMERLQIQSLVEDRRRSRSEGQRGQIIAAWIATACLAVTVYAIHEKAYKVAGVFGTTTIVALVAIFVTGRLPRFLGKQSGGDGESKPPGAKTELAPN